MLKLNVERLRARRAGVQQMLYDMLKGLSDEETEEFCEDILRSLESDGRPPSFAPMLVQMLETRSRLCADCRRLPCRRRTREGARVAWTGRRLHMAWQR